MLHNPCCISFTLLNISELLHLIQIKIPACSAFVLIPIRTPCGLIINLTIKIPACSARVAWAFCSRALVQCAVPNVDSIRAYTNALEAALGWVLIGVYRIEVYIIGVYIIEVYIIGVYIIEVYIISPRWFLFEAVLTWFLISINSWSSNSDIRFQLDSVNFGQLFSFKFNFNQYSLSALPFRIIILLSTIFRSPPSKSSFPVSAVLSPPPCAIFGRRFQSGTYPRRPSARSRSVEIPKTTPMC
jgi:hypothetical protein